MVKRMENESEIQRAKISFPWLGILLACGLIGLLLFLLTAAIFPEAVSIRIPKQLLNIYFIFGWCLVTVGVLAWEVRRFYLQRRNYDQTLDHLFKAKRHLQIKAHASSSHSDKLKLFISERLLEYIQYDEKFLHFKNIASEVRHNGVICFDQVQTALTEAISLYETNAEDSVPSMEVERCRSAINSMRYLWDLLDLSTTDNISLHIGNYLCECEEQYIQSLMQESLPVEANEQSPYTPTYEAHKVVLNVFTLSLDSFDLSDAIETFETDDTSYIQYSDAQHFVRLETGIEMLGNENHLRLLTENLINNAQFYMKKRNVGKTQKPIAIELTAENNQMHLAVYNRGDHVDEKNQDKIFQLGFSTRRKKDNHGKGLGLHFASSIAQGYEGNIGYSNITNNVDTFSMRIELQNGELHTEIIETALVDEQSVILVQDQEDTKKQMQWKFPSQIKSVELFSKRLEQTYLFADADAESVTYMDPSNSAVPAWSLTTENRKRSSTLTFSPLDVRGVKFEVTLPTAKARLNYSDETELSDTDLDALELGTNYDNIIELERRFKG